VGSDEDIVEMFDESSGADPSLPPFRRDPFDGDIEQFEARS
jgi:hypothetical protein